MDTARGFHYSASTNFFSLASTYATALSGPSIQLSSQQVGTQTVWIRIFDNDNGYRDYNAVLKVPDLAVAASSSSQINLTWTDNITGETGWRVQRSTDGVNFSLYRELPANTNHFEDARLDAGTTYTYEIRAYGTAGTSNDTGYSPPKAATTILPAPTNPSAEALGAGGALVSWTDNSTNETNFVVQWAPLAGGYSDAQSVLTGADANVAVVYGLTPGTAYKFRVYAKNSVTQSLPTADMTATPSGSGDADPAPGPPAAGAPGIPTNLSVNIYNGQFSWTDQYGLDGYYIQQDIDPSFPHPIGRNLITHSTSASITLAGLKGASAYFLRVKAYNAAGPSDWSSTLTLVTAPGNFGVAGQKEGETDLKWDAGIGNTQLVLERQQYTHNNSFMPVTELHAIATIDGHQTRFSDSNLMGNMHYGYSLSVKYGDFTSSAVCTTRTTTIAPKNLKIVLTQSSMSYVWHGKLSWVSQYNITWGAENNPETAYVLQYSTDSGATWRPGDPLIEDPGAVFFDGNSNGHTFSYAWDESSQPRFVRLLAYGEVAPSGNYLYAAASDPITVAVPSTPPQALPPNYDTTPVLGIRGVEDWSTSRFEIDSSNSGTSSITADFWPMAGPGVPGLDFPVLPSSWTFPPGSSSIHIPFTPSPTQDTTSMAITGSWQIKGGAGYRANNAFRNLSLNWPVFADLDIDSNNTNGRSMPSQAVQDEDAIEDDPGKPGKIIQVGADQAVPMNLNTSYELPDPYTGEGDATVTLSILSGADEVRVFSSGNTSGTPLLDSSHTQISWDYWDVLPVVWVEGVNPSAAIGDVEFHLTISGEEPDPKTGDPVQVAATDKVRATVMGTKIVGVNPVNNQLTEDSELDLSEPTPVFSNLSVTIPPMSLAPNADETEILGDIVISSNVDDALSDLMKGADGRVKTVSVFLNDDPTAIATINVTDDPSRPKPTTAGSSLLKPFDFLGTFSATLPGQQLQPGWNTLSLRASNAYGFSGVADIPIEIEATPPPDEQTDIQMTFSSDPYLNSNATLSVSFQQNGGGWGSPIALIRQNNGLEYSNGNCVVIFDSLNAFRANMPDQFIATVTNPLVDLNEMPIALTETGNNTLVLAGTSTTTEEDRQNYHNYSFTASVDITGAQISGGGPLHPYLIEVDGPVDIATFIDKVSLGDGATARSLTNYDGHAFVSNPDISSTLPAVFIATFDPNQLVRQLPALPKEVTDLEDYERGVADGLAAPFIQLKEAAVSAGKAVKLAVTHPNLLTETLVATLTISYSFVKSGQAAQAAVETSQKVLDFADTSFGPTVSILKKLSSDPEDTMIGLIAGTLPEIQQLPPQARDALSMASGILEALAKQVQDSYTQGYCIGYVVSTCVIFIIQEVATAGVATLIEMAPQLVAQAGETFAPFIRAALNTEGIIVDAAGTSATVEEGSVAAAKLATKMCFVAGTKVHTAGGPKNIENVSVGDSVLSRDAKTGQQCYKPVLQTAVTHPSRLYHIHFRTSQGRTDRLVTTGEHPFFVRERGDFVPAKDLGQGDHLALAEGQSAEVVASVVEDAVDAKTFTTYNFEVADFHTYFVGEAGVWVHNAGGLCERMFALYTQIVETRGLQNQPWEAFKVLLQKTAGMSERVDAALPDAAADVMKDVYRLADGDFTKVPSVEDMLEQMDGRSANAALDVHHTAPKQWARRLLETLPQYQNLTEAQWAQLLDEMPGMVLGKVDHVTGGGMSFHEILADEFKVHGAGSNQIILQNLEDAYTKWDPVNGPKVWSVARGWLRFKGLV